jgi:hypothetical protein
MRALEIAPAHTAYKLHSNLSLVALSAGDPAEAISQAQRALDLAPEDFTTVSPCLHPLPPLLRKTELHVSADTVHQYLILL